MDATENIGRVIVAHKGSYKLTIIEKVSEQHFDEAAKAFGENEGFTLITADGKKKHAFRSTDIDELTFESN